MDDAVMRGVWQLLMGWCTATDDAATTMVDNDGCCNSQCGGDGNAAAAASSPGGEPTGQEGLVDIVATDKN
jgi:hypothetical protein